MSFPLFTDDVWYETSHTDKLDRPYICATPRSNAHGLLVPNNYIFGLFPEAIVLREAKEVHIERFPDTLVYDLEKNPNRTIAFMIISWHRNILGFYFSPSFIDMYGAKHKRNLFVDIAEMQCTSYSLLLTSDSIPKTDKIYYFDSVAGLIAKMGTQEELAYDLKEIARFVEHAKVGDIAKISILDRWYGYIIRR